MNNLLKYIRRNAIKTIMLTIGFTILTYGVFCEEFETSNLLIFVGALIITFSY
jgi:membrane-bound ClpP family serine protease